MSSHHIVRDEQEPALLIWQPGQLNYEQAGELLEWSPRVVVAQPALAEALDWGIKLDAVWTHKDRLEEIKTAVAHQAPVLVFPFEENSSLQEVMQWLKDRNQLSVNLLADAEAQDFTLLWQLMPLQQLLQVQVLSKGWRYSFFRPGFVLKWLPEKSLVRIVSFAGAPEIISTQVEGEVQQNHLQHFKIMCSGMLKINAAHPFWLGEQI